MIARFLIAAERDVQAFPGESPLNSTIRVSTFPDLCRRVKEQHIATNRICNVVSAGDSDHTLLHRWASCSPGKRGHSQDTALLTCRAKTAAWGLSFVTGAFVDG